jgi:hypothetical protein
MDFNDAVKNAQERRRSIGRLRAAYYKSGCWEGVYDEHMSLMKEKCAFEFVPPDARLMLESRADEIAHLTRELNEQRERAERAERIAEERRVSLRSLEIDRAVTDQWIRELRERYGAREDETFPEFVGRLHAERELARANTCSLPGVGAVRLADCCCHASPRDRALVHATLSRCWWVRHRAH